ncbi:MAG: PKD domain-containing protein [Patescibacteria group bacterium]
MKKYIVIGLLIALFVVGPGLVGAQTSQQDRTTLIGRLQSLIQLLQQQLAISQGQTSPTPPVPVPTPTPPSPQETVGFLGVSVMGRAQPFLRDPLGRGNGILPRTMEAVQETPEVDMGISAMSSGFGIKNPLAGVYQVYNTNCLKGERLNFTISFFGKDNRQEEDVSWICSSPDPVVAGWVTYGKDIQFSFNLNPLLPKPIQPIYTVQPPMNVRSASLGSVQSPQTQISWSAPGANIGGYKVYARRDDYPKFDLLLETSKTNITTPHPWLHYFDSSNTSTDFMKLWHYAVTSVDSLGQESPVIYTVSNHSPLIARFDAYPKCGPAPLIVRFTDRSAGNPTSWSWDFDLTDNNRDSTEQNPVHVFTREGSYTVDLTVGGLQGTDTNYNISAIEVNNKGTCSINTNATFPAYSKVSLAKATMSSMRVETELGTSSHLRVTLL